MITCYIFSIFDLRIYRNLVETPHENGFFLTNDRKKSEKFVKKNNGKRFGFF